jgi:hypothetical protein
MSNISTVANYGGRIQPQGNIKQFYIGPNGSIVNWIYQTQNNLKVQTTADQTTPVYVATDLYVGGNIYNSSDERLKNNIIPIKNNKTNDILNLNPVEFNYKSDKKVDKTLHYGFIAQEVEKVYPELVKTGFLGYKNVNYIELIPLLLLKMKDMQNEINELKEHLNTKNEDI